jgi:hypothetical protein
VHGYPVRIFSPEWIVREKILTQYQRQGAAKERSDIQDLSRMLVLIPERGRAEVDFDSDRSLVDRGLLAEALGNLVRKRPALEERLRGKIKCRAVFGE